MNIEKNVIDKKFLLKLLDKDLISKLEGIDREKLNHIIDNANFSIRKENERLIKRVAFLMSNPTDEKIVFVQGKDIELLSDPAVFIARMLDEQDKIQVFFNNFPDSFYVNNNMNKDVFSAEKYDINYMLQIKEERIFLDVTPEILENTWHQPKFVLDKISAIKYDRYDKISKYRRIKNLFPESLWDNEDFNIPAIRELTEAKLYDEIPETVWNSSAVFENLKKDSNLLSNLLILVLLPRYTNEKIYQRKIQYLSKDKEKLLSTIDIHTPFENQFVDEDFVYKVCNRSILKELKLLDTYLDLFFEKCRVSTSIMSYEYDEEDDYSEEYKFKELLVLHQDLKQKIQVLNKKDNPVEDIGYKQLIENLDVLLNDKSFLLSHTKLVPGIYLYLNKENRLDIDVIKCALDFKNLDSHLYYNVEQYIPKKVFSDVNNLTVIYDLLAIEYQHKLKHLLPHFVENLNNKEKLLNFLQNINQTPSDSLTSLFHALPPALQKDKDVAKSFCSITIRIFSFLEEELKSDFELIKLCVEKDGSDLLEKEALYSLEDKALIKQLLSKKPKILLDDSCPVAWKQDPQLIFFVNDSKFFKNYTEDDWYKLTNNDLDKYTELVYRDREIYKYLPKKIQEEESLGLILAESNMGIVAKKLWGKRSFCIKALELDMNTVEKIPDYFWEDKEFILEFCKILDQKAHWKDALLVNQKLRKFFDSFDINENYYEFMKSYILQTQLKKDNKDTVQKKNKI